MRQRDKAIVNSLTSFRCMSRDDIVELYFSDLKSPVTSCNYVLKRLRRDGYVDVNVNMRPYIYFPKPSPIKKDSAKIPHFLAIVDFYRQLCAISKPRIFEVEPKFGKGQPEPDVFTIWKGAPFFVEVQRSTYSAVVMQAKIRRYEEYVKRGDWRNLPWQPKPPKRPVFPFIWLITEAKYNLSTSLRVFQSRDVVEFLRKNERK